MKKKPEKTITEVLAECGISEVEAERLLDAEEEMMDRFWDKMYDDALRIVLWQVLGIVVVVALFVIAVIYYFMK